jgi:Ca2+-binding RTX toxin-like protein
MLFGGFDDDMISAGSGNNELYAGDGADILQGGPGGGSGFDIVVGFDPTEGDTNANNCEDIIQHL